MNVYKEKACYLEVLTMHWNSPVSFWQSLCYTTVNSDWFRAERTKHYCEAQILGLYNLLSIYLIVSFSLNPIPNLKSYSFLIYAALKSLEHLLGGGCIQHSTETTGRHAVINEASHTPLKVERFPFLSCSPALFPANYLIFALPQCLSCFAFLLSLSPFMLSNWSNILIFFSLLLQETC